MDDLLTDAQLPGWSWTGQGHPSHVIIHGSLVETTGEHRGQTLSVGDILRNSGYRQVWSRWNGLDWASDADAKGHLGVWARRSTETMSEHVFKHVDDL